MKKIFSLCLFCLVFLHVSSQIIFSKNGKYGLKDSLGKVICKAKYDIIEEFQLNVSIIKLNYKYGIISNKGVELIAPIYTLIKPLEFFSTTFDVQLDKQWGVINFDGELVVKPKYLEPVNMSLFDDYTIVTMAKSIEISSGYTTKMYGVLDNNTFVEIIQPKYNSIVDKGFGYFKVKLDDKLNKFGLLDSTNTMIFEIKYDDIFAVSKDIISYKKNNKWVLVNSKGYSISSYEYENVFRQFEKRAKVRREGKYGYIDEKGKEIIPCQYDEADVRFDQGKVSVKKNKIKMEIDLQGNEVTELKTIKPRTSLEFIGVEDERVFNSIQFKTNVSDSNNLKLVDQYLSYYTHYTAIYNAVDNLISEASNNKQAYKDMTNYLYAKYLNSKFACYDAVPIYIAKKYICDEDAPYGGGYWVGEKNKMDIFDYCIKNTPNLCGQVLPNYSFKLLPQTNSNYLKLNSVKKKYTILMFWKNECDFCEKQIQFLSTNYAKFQELGVEIIGISIDENAKDKCEQLIVSHNMNWINTVDIGQTLTKQLNVLSVPNLFLLDADKRIIYKKLTAEQILKYLNEKK